MEELHEAAIAYYNNGTDEQRALAWQFFQAMDTDHDGRVSFHEYSDFLRRTGGFLRPQSFQDLDRDRNGSLDFWEVLTLYYIARTRTLTCRTCHRSLEGLHFTCLACFDSPSHESATFDLCVSCYRARTYDHHHRLFLDSYVLLRSRRRNHPQLPDPPVAPPPNHNPPQDIAALQNPARMRWWHALKAMEIALAVGNLATFCTIM